MKGILNIKVLIFINLKSIKERKTKQKWSNEP